METDNLVRTTTTEGSDLRYMTTTRATDASTTEREQMAATSDENPFQNPPINDRSTGIHSMMCDNDIAVYGHFGPKTLRT